MAFPALLDTCTLFSATLTDTLLRIAEQGAFRPHWSAGILGELETVLIREAGVAPEKAARRIGMMRSAFPDAEVAGYTELIESMTCDPKDRHVLAAAVAAACPVLVSFNVRDFPLDSVGVHGITVVTPDAFLLDQIDLHPAKVGRALLDQLTAARRPPLTMGQLLGRLTRAGAGQFAEEARRHEFGQG